MNIIIVEDDKSINNLVKESLQLQGYSTICTFSGNQALKSIEDNTIDLAIIDLMLPDMYGLDLIKRFKEVKIPVIIISAIIDTISITKGLDLGADDYLTKPFDIIELNARINALVRRVYNLGDILTYEDIKVNLSSSMVTVSEKEVLLTLKEYNLLNLLLSNKGIVLSRSYLYETVWGDDLSYESRTLDLHIQRLRKKLNLGTKLVSVYKLGYKLI